jgi:acyl-CoA hydrolase
MFANVTAALITTLICLSTIPNVLRHDTCRNPVIEFHSGVYVSDPQVMAKIENLVSIVGALKVDLTGQGMECDKKLEVGLSCG